jgi:hypothetical protein
MRDELRARRDAFLHKIKCRVSWLLPGLGLARVVAAHEVSLSKKQRLTELCCKTDARGLGWWRRRQWTA